VKERRVETEGTSSELFEIGEHSRLEVALREELEHSESRLDVILTSLTELT